ncbi:MAG: helix-turn-helix domain-containing protein [Burkholderiales bacterium]|nr:helix-turn-helix domain-containing protein [Burkholderiales bacterium]
MSEETPVAELASPGQALAAARAELNLSLADVSQQIKYGVKQIAAIEADDYSKLPGTTFVRGMIRSYAKLVQIDPEPLLAGLCQRATPPVVAVDLRISGQEPFVEGGAKSNRIYVLLSLAALLAVAIVAYEWRVGPLDTGEVVTIMPKSAQSDASEAAPAPVIAPVPVIAPAPVTAPAPSAPAPSAPAPTSMPETSAKGTGQAVEMAAQPTAPAAAPSTSALKRIELEFDALSWVEIKQADGKILLSQLNRPGTKQVIEGVPPLDVVIGNAASTRLKYDDAPIDLRPFFKVDVARLKLE